MENGKETGQQFRVASGNQSKISMAHAISNCPLVLVHSRWENTTYVKALLYSRPQKSLQERAFGTFSVLRNMASYISNFNFKREREKNQSIAAKM